VRVSRKFKAQKTEAGLTNVIQHIWITTNETRNSQKEKASDKSTKEKASDNWGGMIPLKYFKSNIKATIESL
jgi:hypothetical protein